MIRVAIVEDEIRYQQMFEEYIRKYADEKSVDVSVKVFSDGMDISEGYEPVWDVILMDIKMRHQDGMEAARVIRQHDQDVAIMFITTLAQYAIHGYEVGALDYVLKPVEYDKFAMRFDRLLRGINRKKEQFIMLPGDDGKDKVEISKIRFIRVDHHNLEINVDSQAGIRNYNIRKSISSIEKELSDNRFVRCDQSVIVNISYITKVKKDTVEVGDIILPVSRAKRKPFMEAIASFNS
nr:LytTR family DNA-binding domain-containing protein [uncultured Butyrivibrio sp.]